MANPYDVLGISQSATDDEVKKAYRTLSKKYHPDANINNPNKEALTEKFKEVQNAYEQIMDMRKNGKTFEDYQSGPQYQRQYSNTYNNQQQYQYKQYTNFEDMFNDMFGGQYQQQYQQQQYQSQDDRYYQAVKSYINSGAYDEAINVLNSISDRYGLWYYYSAYCNARLGNMISAKEYAETAVRMEPDNMTYRDLLTQIQSGRVRYQQRGTSYGFPPMNAMSCCYYVMICNMISICCCGGGGYMPFICC